MPDEQEQESGDLRSALSAAWDKAAEAPSTTETTEAPEAPAGSIDATPLPVDGKESTTESRARDEKGRFATGTAKGESAPQKPDAKAQEGVAAPPQAIGQPPAQSTPPAPAVDPWSKAPQSLKPEAREEWAKVPPAVQQEIHRRERETAVAIQRATESHRQIEPLLRTLQPYAQQLQARGLPVDQVVGNFLRTEQALSHPSESVRADVLAGALPTYSVSVEALAAALDRRGSGGTQAPVAGAHTQSIDPQQIIAQAKAEFTRELQQQRFQSATQSATAEIESFSAQAEFLDDVRDTTAALLDSAARAGVALTLKDAYEQACWADPKIRGIFQQREASKQAATGAQATQRARAASSSVKSTPGGAHGNGAPPDTWREALEQSWDKAAGKQ